MNLFDTFGSFFSISKFVLNINKQFLAFVKFTLGLILKYSCQYLECKESLVYISNKMSSISRLKLDSETQRTIFDMVIYLPQILINF